MPQLAYKDVHEAEPAGPANPYAELGEMLLKARENSQLSKWDVASFLHVEPWVIDALESGDFQRLTAPVYIKGYLRNYARVVNLPVEPLIERYNQVIGYEAAPTPTPSQDSDSTDEQQLQWGPYLLAAALILLPILWIAQRTAPERSSQENSQSGAPAERIGRPDASEGHHAEAIAEQQTGQPVEDGLPETAAAEEANGLGSVAPASPESSMVKDVQTTTTAISPTQKTTALPPTQDRQASPAEKVTSAPVQDGQDHIKVSVTSSAWVSIRDHSGRRVAYETVTPGTARIFSGLAPFHVVLGNSPVTKIELNGQPFNQSKYNVGSIARFDMGQSSQSSPRPQAAQAKPMVSLLDRPVVSAKTPSPPAQAAQAKPTVTAVERPAASAKAPPLPPSVQAGSSGPDQIKVRVTADSWVAIRDQTGKRVAYETVPKGSERTYSGVAPFVVVLGNSPATKIALNGKPFNQSRFNVGISARFSLSK